MAQPFEWRHPELREGEVFLGNFDRGQFERVVNWQTKRLGTMAFNASLVPASGNPEPVFPVFIQRSEAQAVGLQLDGQYNVTLNW